MSAPTGSSASSSISEPRLEPTIAENGKPAAAGRPRSNYRHDLVLRREAAAIREQTVYGLVLGWVLTLIGGFIYCCVPSQIDWLWLALLVAGLLHLAAAVVLPQLLAWPERIWIAIARWQGLLVMTVLLTGVYYVLIWPAGRLSRRRIHGFCQWEDEPPAGPTAWQPLAAATTEDSIERSGRRSLPLLLLSTIGFFVRRGNYVVVAILVLLMVLGLALYFVQSSPLAPFIYTLF